MSPPNAFFIAPVIVVWPCVFIVGRCIMFFPMKSSGIWWPSLKMLWSASSSFFGLYSVHLTSGSGSNGMRYFLSIWSHLFCCAPSNGFVTTVLFSTARIFLYPSVRNVFVTPSSCQGCVLHAG